MAKQQKYPNQRTITVNKALTDKTHKFTANNLEALDEAARRLVSKGGFKLYMYLAKNQNKYNFNLYSSDFMLWGSMAATAYTTAFKELEKEGYLVETSKGNYIFYDKSQKPEEPKDNKNAVNITIPEEKVEEYRELTENFSF